MITTAGILYVVLASLTALVYLIWLLFWVLEGIELLNYGRGTINSLAYSNAVAMLTAWLVAKVAAGLLYFGIIIALGIVGIRYASRPKKTELVSTAGFMLFALTASPLFFDCVLILVKGSFFGTILHDVLLCATGACLALTYVFGAKKIVG